MIGFCLVGLEQDDGGSEPQLKGFEKDESAETILNFEIEGNQKHGAGIASLRNCLGLNSKTGEVSLLTETHHVLIFGALDALGLNLFHFKNDDLE